MTCHVRTGRLDHNKVTVARAELENALQCFARESDHAHADALRAALARSATHERAAAERARREAAGLRDDESIDSGCGAKREKKNIVARR